MPTWVMCTSGWGRNNEAIICFRKALSIKPDYVEAYSNLGNLYRIEGNHDEAIACYRKAGINQT